jgi:hypothetical protein
MKTQAVCIHRNFIQHKKALAKIRQTADFPPSLIWGLKKNPQSLFINHGSTKQSENPDSPEGIRLSHSRCLRLGNRRNR